MRIHTERGRGFRRLCSPVAVLCLLLPACILQAQQKNTPEDTPVTIFNHSDSSRWYAAGQVNLIAQGHPAFHSPYSGPNSLRPDGETKVSRVLTLYTGLQATRTTEVIFDLESTGGRGVGDALGLAGFTNLDVVRNPDLGSKPYLARLMVRQIIPLSKDEVESGRTPLSLATRLPARRLEFRVGKFSIVDFFDVNDPGSDSHLQFLNWTVDDNGAYDYAANTRGYTWGGLVEYEDRHWGLRFAEAMMPKVANGIDLDPILRRAHSENVELELRPKLSGHAAVVRLLGYANHATMGSYREAIDDFLAHRTSVPDISATRRQGRLKYGFGLNLEQAITPRLRGFARLGWNDGRTESFAYTEVDQTVLFGGDYRGDRWGRKLDKAGAAFVSNAISHDHQHYLALGGVGFLLGDSRLTYGREDILETYYTAHLWRGVFASLDFQHITNPGYNRDRGPVWVPALRLHFDL